jgi:hypothetical protein
MTKPTILLQAEAEWNECGVVSGERAKWLMNEVKALREMVNNSIDAEFDHWAPIQTKIEGQDAEKAKWEER